MGWDPVLFLVVSRLERARLEKETATQPSDAQLAELVLPCLALFEFARGRVSAGLLFRPSELGALRPGSFTELTRSAPPISPEGRWLQLKEKYDAKSPAIEKLMKLEGLHKVRDVKKERAGRFFFF